MSVTIQLHPAIQHYFKEFNNFTKKPSGILTQNMDRLVFQEKVKMTGS